MVCHSTAILAVEEAYITRADSTRIAYTLFKFWQGTNSPTRPLKSKDSSLISLAVLDSAGSSYTEIGLGLRCCYIIIRSMSTFGIWSFGMKKWRKKYRKLREIWFPL